MSSIGSTCSSMVSFRGEDEVDVSEALDVLFKEMQENLNGCHCSVRQLAMSEERADTYMEAAEHHFAIEDYANVLTVLFKELKSVSKQVLGTCPSQYKDEFKALQEKRKQAKKMRPIQE
jgi:hypothetical protein